MDLTIRPLVRVPLAAGPNTVREIFLPEAQDWGFALWSAGAALPLWLRSATRYTSGNGWSPVAKAPSRPAHSKAAPPEPRAWTRVEQIYARQYWAGPPVQPPPRAASCPWHPRPPGSMFPASPDLGVPGI
jgi:hypothetical protein